MPAQGTALQYVVHPDRGDGGPHPVARAGGVGVAPSSFGLDATTLGPDYGARGIWDSARKAELQFRQSYYRCTSHDWKVHAFDGSMISSGRQSITQPMMSSSANTPSTYVPLSRRRPSMPYRLGRKIVGAFTGLLFGHGRWPQMRSDDPDTQAWAEAVAKAGKLQQRMTQARNQGGSCGTVGLSWAWEAGRPRFRVHDGRFIHALEWLDPDDRVPAHVTQLQQRAHVVTDKKTGKPKTVAFWHREDWTTVADVVFLPVEVTDEEPDWEAHVDEERTVVHDHGRCHFAWVQNLPADDVDDDDGQSDYAETYEQMDGLDVMNSVLHKGTVLNLDPTLVISADEEQLGVGAIKKGSDNALLPGVDGDAKYLELAGTAIEAGIKVIELEKDQILDACECVLVDPDKAAAAGTSSVTLKIVYASMIGRTDLMRTSYGDGLERLLNDVTDYARMHLPDEPGQRVVEDVPVYGEDGEPVLDPETGEGSTEEREVQFLVDLPPRVRRAPRLGPDGEPVLGPDGAPLEDEVREPQRPGRGDVTLEWGEYFKPTADDLQKGSAAVSQATGGKAALSQRGGVEIVANAFNRDADQEWADIQRETLEARRHEAALSSGMFPGADADPGGASPAYERDPGEIDEEFKQLFTVRRALALVGQPPLLGPDGAESPDNDLSVAEFTAKAAAKGAAEGNLEGGGAPPSPFGGGRPSVDPGLRSAPPANDDEPPEPTPFAPRE